MKSDLEKAKDCGRYHLGLTVILSLCIGAFVLILRRPIMSLFGVSEAVRSMAIMLLTIYALEAVMRNIPFMLVCGVFRSGGDVKFGLVGDTIAMWVYAVPMGLLCAFVLKLPEMWVYFILCLDEFVKMPAFLMHYRSKKWLRNITREMDN